MATTSVLGALVEKLQGYSFSPVVPSLWAITLPGKPAFPGILVEYPRTEFQWTFEGESQYCESPLLVLKCYANTGQNSESLLRQALKCLCDQPLSGLETGTVLQVYPSDLYVRRTEVRGPNGEEMVEGVLEIKVDVQRLRHPTNIVG